MQHQTKVQPVNPLLLTAQPRYFSTGQASPVFDVDDLQQEKNQALVHLKWEKRNNNAVEVSSEEADLNGDDIFYRKMEKELMYDFRRDAIKRGAPNECLETIRQIHCDHHEQVLSGKTNWRRVKNRPPLPIWW